MTLALLALLAHAAEPTVTIAGERLPDPHRWLEDIDDPEVVAWWKAKDVEARAWIAEQGDEEVLARWVKDRDDPSSVTLLDEANGTRILRRRIRLPEPPTDTSAVTTNGSAAPDAARKPSRKEVEAVGKARLDKAGARWASAFVATRDGVDHALLTPELGEDRPPCAATVDPSGRFVAWGRTLDTEDHPCRLHITDLAEDRTWTVFEGQRPQPRFSPDAERLLVSHATGDRGALLEITREGEALGERLRSPHMISVDWLADGNVIAMTLAEAGTGHPLPNNRVAFGPPERLSWLGEGPFGPPHGRYTWVGGNGDTLLLRTNVDAERFRVVRVDPQRPFRSRWEEVVPERKDAELTQARRLGDHLLLVWAKDGVSTLTARPLAGDTPDEPLGIASSGSLHVTVRGDEALVSISSVEGTRNARLSADLGVTWLDMEPPRALTFTTEHATSADGTTIPVSIARPSGATTDAPVWLHVYGGFGKGQRLLWSATVDAWLAMGGVYAVVHARGGDERGEAWHDAARREHKHRSIDDVIAAAEHFVAGATPAGRIVLSGVSNGGLVSAAAVAKRPELFGALLADVGVYDLVRAPVMGNWLPREFGRPGGPMVEQRALRALSPLHATPPGPLPPVLFETGRDDRVVSPAHSFKLAAAWGALPGGPVLLRVDPWITHARRGDNPDLDLGAQPSALASDLAFVMRALDLEWEMPEKAGGSAE